MIRSPDSIPLSEKHTMAADSFPPDSRQDSSTDDSVLTESKPGVSEPKKLNTRKVLGLVVLAGVIVSGGLKGYDWWTTGRFEVRTDNAYVRADITMISPKVQGYVQSISVKDNQVVEAGDILFTLESADFAARTAEAEAALAQAESDVLQAQAQLFSQKALLDTAVAQVASQNSHIKESQAGVSLAEAKSEQAKSERNRDKELADKGHYPTARLEDAETAVHAAEAELARAQAAEVTQRSQIALAKSGIDRATQDIAAAEAAMMSAESRVAAAQARVESARLDAGRTEIRAPISGVVANRMMTLGQLLNPGQHALSIVPVQEAYVIANFKETQVEHMRPGQDVELTFDAYSDLKATGRVDSLSPASGAQFSLIPQDTATGNFTKIVQRIPVRIAISEQALATGMMRPGLSVEAVVTVKQDN